MSAWDNIESRHIRNVLRSLPDLASSANLPEVEHALLKHLCAHIPERIGVDVGVFRGAYLNLFRQAGFRAFGFEPIPSRVAELRRKWAHDPMVTIERVALSDEDGLADIHLGDWKIAEEQALNPGDLFNTLERRPDNDVLTFSGALSVARRRLAWFVEVGLIPHDIGVLKIDAEGHDLAVLRGAWPHLGRVTLCEYWSSDFLFSGGAAKNDLSHYEDFFADKADMQALVLGRDAAHPALFYQVNPRETARNSWGNILFTTDAALFAEATAWCEEIIGAHAARA